MAWQQESEIQEETDLTLPYPVHKIRIILGDIAIKVSILIITYFNVDLNIDDILVCLTL